MITVLTPTISCLQQSDPKLMAESKSLILVYAELVKSAKQALNGTTAARIEKIVIPVPLNLVGFAV